uniref:Protein kinase domain-containing protein n=1 Tax=Globisporangium ultimum (strain ATCC 200006 / CBS 805.95 / DAOM BR144) TaxID=431595 RepID=K3XD12_GLOUD
MYCKLLTRIKDYVRVALSEDSVARLARSQQVAKKHHVIFAELDRILDMLQVPANDPIRNWEQDRNDIDKRVLQQNQDTSVIGPKNEAVTLTHLGSESSSPHWDLDGQPVVSDAPPSWYLALRDVQFSLSDSIGEGAFGTVYKGTWLDTPVVVKFMGYEADHGTSSTKLSFTRNYYNILYMHVNLKALTVYYNFKYLDFGEDSG